MERSYLFCAAVMVLNVTTMPADVTVKAAYKAGAVSSSSTVYLSKARQRFEYPGGIKLIRQMDQHRIIEIDDEGKSWVAMPLDPAAESGPRNGGIVTVTTTIRDTGETKAMFGLTARHLKTTVVTASGPGTCEARQETVETDGWYVDIDYPETPATDPVTAGCKDEVRYQTIGAAKAGYPLAYTSRTIRGKEETTVSMEVTELSTAALPASLFEPPAGYTERKSVAAMAAARPKPAGVARVGVVAIGDASGHQLAVGPLNSRLAALLTNKEVQGVPISSAAEAEAAHCDFILQTEVGAVNKSAVGQVAGHVLKFGGMLSRGGGKAPAQDGTEATLNFKLVRNGHAEPELASSATGKNGSALNLKTAIQIASIASPMGMMMHTYGGQGFGMFAMQWTNGSAYSAADPGMSMLFRGLEQAPPGPASPEMSAVSAALESEAQAISAAVQKAK